MNQKVKKYKNELIITCTLLGVTLFGLANYANKDGMYNHPHATHAEEVVTLDSTNAPTASTEFVNEIEYAGVAYATYTFTQVKASVNNLCELDLGGTITKDQAKGLTQIKVKFTGSLKLETWFAETDTERSTYTLTSDTFTVICGNYFNLIAESATVINQMTVIYSCVLESTGHEYVEGTPFLNGEDYDRIDVCSLCGHEKLVEMVSKGAYRGGEFVLAATQGTAPATFSATTTTVGGVENPYLYSNPSAQWNNRLSVEIVNNYTIQNPTAVKNEVNRLDVKYFQFDLYAASNAVIRLYAMKPIEEGQTAASAHAYVGLTPGLAINYTTNPGIQLYQKGSPTLATTFESNVWYTVIVDYTNLIWPVAPTNATSIEFSYTAGNVYLNDVRYYHENPTPVAEGNYLAPNKLHYDFVTAGIYSFITLALSNRSTLDIDGYYNNEVVTDWVITMETNTLVVLDGNDIVSQGIAGSDTLTLTYTKGSVILTTDISVDVRAPEAHDGSEFIQYTGTTPTNTYVSVGEHLGKTGIYKSSGGASTSYVNQLDVKLTSASTGLGTHAENYADLKQKGISHISFDLLLETSGSLTRLQSRTTQNSTFYTNIVQVGQTYKAFNAGVFNDKIDIYYENELNQLVEVDSSYVFQANVWYLVVVDISYVLTQNYSGAGYMNVSVTAAFGEIYLGNVTYYCPKNI